jgi:Protein of unknown function (DUF4199)
MSTNLSPAIKGLIIALVMLCVSFALYYNNVPANSLLQYSPYCIYGLGIIWALLAYRQSSAYTGKFRDLFSQGFRCFIVITLMMVVVTGIFVNMHPEFAEENAKLVREKLVTEKQKTLPEIEREVKSSRDQFTLSFVYGSIFGYLIIGAVITAGCSVFLIRRKE